MADRERIRVGGRTLRFDDPLIGTLQPEDVLVVVKAHEPGKASRPPTQPLSQA